MTTTISNQQQWQLVYKRQSLANAKHWLALVENCENVSELAQQDYDNLLRALEFSLSDDSTYEIAYRLVRALFDLGNNYADWDRWLVYLERVLSLSKRQGVLAETTWLLEKIGSIYHNKCNYPTAEKQLKIVQENYLQLNDQHGYAIATIRLAVNYAIQGKSELGIQLCQQALEIGDSLADELIQAHANLNLSSIYNRTGDYEKTIQSAEKAYQLYRRLNEKTYANKVMVNIAHSWVKLGNWQKVDELSRYLVEELLEEEDIHTYSTFKLNLGNIAFNQKEYEVAERHLQEALQLYSQLPKLTELAYTYNNLGLVYTEMQEWETAEAMLQKAIDIQDKLGDIFNWANATDNLATLYEIQGNTAVIPDLLIPALKALKSISDTPRTQKLLLEIEERLARVPP
ncbi:MAG: tetratricopeptide repeat protein [Chloroflexi bacterium]|nr:tetratricopeptide repeat protein [Chloroflexota bacterium]